MEYTAQTSSPQDWFSSCLVKYFLSSSKDKLQAMKTVEQSKLCAYSKAGESGLAVTASERISVLNEILAVL